MSKRANGEGNVYQRANGRWESRMTYTDPDTGQTRRQSFYGATANEVRAKMKAAQDREDAGAPVKDSTMTVAQFLTGWRATTLAISDRAATTKQLYADLCGKHLEMEPFGVMQLDKVKPSDIEALILRMRTATKPGKRTDDDTEPIPVRRHYPQQLRCAAYRAGRGRSRCPARAQPAALVKRPGVERREAHHLTASDVTRLLAADEGLSYANVLKLIATTGLRRGEALALTWDRLDLDTGVLKVQATTSRIGKQLVTSQPKTERSRRVVPLSPAVVTMRKAHRKVQLEERMRAANQWQGDNLGSPLN